MSYELVNRPVVKEDVLNAVEYYKKISSPLGKQFLFRIREAKTFIVRSPLGFQIKYKKSERFY